MEYSAKQIDFMLKTLKLIYEKGFMATSMRDIAKHFNFEVANVYNYIDSKDSILEYFIFHILDEFEGYMSNVMDSSYSSEDKLKFLISKHIRFTFNEPYQVALFVYDWRNFKEPRLSEFKERRKAYLEKFGAIIEDGIEQGVFRKMDIQMSTFLVFSSLRWLFNIIIHEKEERNPIETEKFVTEYIFNGIGVT
ncbi:TetR/AcrR family transcriptional regulator [Maribacter sp. 2307UL18-2]|uniref:TetR/AcrR family transcriptional regulator n=1 Tax=Maribacter sp. 2307UL18-2 TaxID=3386274 RepID=UPI0039BC4830